MIMAVLVIVAMLVIVAVVMAVVVAMVVPVIVAVVMIVAACVCMLVRFITFEFICFSLCNRLSKIIYFCLSETKVEFRHLDI
jgi:hypothetical protein